MGENGKKYLMYGGGLAVLLGLGVFAYKLNKRKSATMFMNLAPVGAPPAVIDPATGLPEIPVNANLPPIATKVLPSGQIATVGPTTQTRRGRGAF